jgi:hypothetical protein
MPDMLSVGANWLTDQLRANAAVTVAYVRSGNTATVPATIGSSTFESSDGNGIIEQWESRDFIVKVEELPYGEPRRGDRIYEELGGVSQIYEVATPRGIPLFRYADAFQTAVRIHTKRVDADLEFLVTEQGDEIVVPLQVN